MLSLIEIMTLPITNHTIYHQNLNQIEVIQWEAWSLLKLTIALDFTRIN